MSQPYDFSVERDFTKTYKQYRSASAALREAKCLRAMYPAIFGRLLRGDMFAGRISMSLIGFSPEPGGLGYYCNAAAIESLLSTGGYTPEQRDEINDMLDFWRTENTSAKVRAAYPPDVARALPDDDWGRKPLPAAPLYRMAGIYLDYGKLLENGIPGLQALVRERKSQTRRQGEDAALFEGMEAALQLLGECCLSYREQAVAMREATDDPAERDNLEQIAVALGNIALRKPETLREAMQLMWLYTLICGSINYGRLDVVFGDFLARDLAIGTLTLQQAQELFNGLWRLMADRRTTWNGRVIIGGRGRKNEANADKAALLALEATRVVKEIEPQLSLRVYKGMDPRLMEKAVRIIGEGRTYPMLYNDDVNIPAVANAFRISVEEAEQYVPFGCGEYVIDHRSFGTPNGIINLLKVLDITLHNGIDSFSGRRAGIETGGFASFDTFDKLWSAYTKQTEYFVRALARQEKIEYDVVGEASPFLFLSLLYDDCLERGKGIFAGGIRYLGGTVETYGNINTADSLTAIKQAVYDEERLTRERLLELLDCDFEGCETERLLLVNAPKYGNDIALADDMAVRVHEHICALVRNQAESVGLHSYLVVIINNSANTTLGKLTSASADGRKKSEYMANANNPWSGNDKNGLTAMLNSLVKLRPDLHAGAVQNMKLSPELFKREGAIVKSVLDSYFDNGGTQAMISVVSRDDLKQAMLHPERYGHLFVRVGGFSARFVELERAVQLEIVNRTLY